ncbi:MAG: hypothetical protein R2874_12485 [Desulfobacterales bacterium]
MNRVVRLVLAVVIIGMLSGCTSKLVRIDSAPAFADIRNNSEYVGKTPLYHRFYDKWYPWPMKKTDDYIIQAQRSGFEPEVQIFHETPVRADISYVPDEVFFKMHPLDDPADNPDSVEK